MTDRPTPPEPTRPDPSISERRGARATRPTPAEEELLYNHLDIEWTVGPPYPNIARNVLAALDDAGYMVVPKGPVRLLDGKILEQRNRAVRALDDLFYRDGSGSERRLAALLLDEPWAKTVLNDDRKQ